MLIVNFTSALLMSSVTLLLVL